jgi:hypothetical protein
MSAKRLPSFVLSARLSRAIHSSSSTLLELGFRCGLHPSHLSKYLHGQPFGPKVRAKVVALGCVFGLDADDCTRQVRS